MKYSMTRQDKGDVLREIQFIWNIPMTTRKGWPFNTSVCLIEVTTWAGLAVHLK
jgi:hypothetical protein